MSGRSVGLNIFYSVLSVHTFIHEHILVQALGLERKQYAYRVLLPNMRRLYNLWRISVHHRISVYIYIKPNLNCKQFQIEEINRPNPS